MSGSGVSVERVMRELKHEIVSERRARIFIRAPGASEYRDPGDLRAPGEETHFQRVLDLRDHDALHCCPSCSTSPDGGALRAFAVCATRAIAGSSARC